MTYECTVSGSGSGATIWKGTAFDCSLISNEFVIFHDINYTSQKPQTCNNGAIIGQVVRAENDSYTSQITIQVSDELNGTTVVCAHDNGTDSVEIGSAILNITTGSAANLLLRITFFINTVPFPPPTDVKLVEANHTHLKFAWNHVSSHCPSIQYHIMASNNCGECPATTHSNMVTCNGNYSQLMHDDHSCLFTVGTVVCNGIVETISIAVTVPMIGTRKGLTNIKTSSSGLCIYRLNVQRLYFCVIFLIDTALLSSIVITLGAVIGVMFIMIVFIVLLFTAILTILLKSKQALRVELDVLKAKMKEQPVIYEEIAQLQDSLKSSSPTIDVGENTAYVSVISMNACVRS